nr:patatin-like phospholipase family protein [Acidimicrobiia bacterium]
ALLASPARHAPRRENGGGMASPARLARALRAPWEIRPGSLAAAVLPAGRVPTASIGAPFVALFGAGWPDADLRLVAVGLDSGRRTVFDGRSAPRVSVGAAVEASCAIPAFFAPVEINGVRYVDGGIHSTTNADVVRTDRPDLVIVSAPMSAVRNAPFTADVAVRQVARLALGREVTGLRRRGCEVVTFQPTAADLEVMRGDSMNAEKMAPVLARVRETASARLADDDVRRRLALSLVSV